MTTSSIIHHPTRYAVTAAVVAGAAVVAALAAAVGLGPLSLSGSDQPTLIQAPSYGAYPPGGQHPGHHHHPTTAGGQTMMGP
jgi:hypothetical protein